MMKGLEEEKDDQKLCSHFPRRRLFTLNFFYELGDDPHRWPQEEQMCTATVLYRGVQLQCKIGTCRTNRYIPNKSVHMKGFNLYMYFFFLLFLSILPEDICRIYAFRFYNLLSSFVYLYFYIFILFIFYSRFNISYLILDIHWIFYIRDDNGAGRPIPIVFRLFEIILIFVSFKKVNETGRRV